VLLRRYHPKPDPDDDQDAEPVEPNDSPTPDAPPAKKPAGRSRSQSAKEE